MTIPAYAATMPNSRMNSSNQSDKKVSGTHPETATVASASKMALIDW
jgi:hypothetical protein